MMCSPPEAVLQSSGSSRTALLDFISKSEEVQGTALLPDDLDASATTEEVLELVNATLATPEVEDHDWGYWNTFFFTFITITTIGYGHLSPKTVLGQQFCVVYSLFGIPLNTLVFVALAAFYSQRVLTTRDQAGAGDRSYTALVLRALVYLVPGLLFFLIIPSVVFMLVEDDWTFLESFYFAFISLTTIGYGDLVAGYTDHYGSWDVLYKAYIMLWTMSGLGYIIMVVTFLIDAFKSKPILDARKRGVRGLKKRTERLQKMLQSLVLQQQTRPGTTSTGDRSGAGAGAGVSNHGFVVEHNKDEIVGNRSNNDQPPWIKDASTLKMVKSLYNMDHRDYEKFDENHDEAEVGRKQRERKVSHSMPSRYKKPVDGEGAGAEMQVGAEDSPEGAPRRRASVDMDIRYRADLLRLVHMVDAIVKDTKALEDASLVGNGYVPGMEKDEEAGENKDLWSDALSAVADSKNCMEIPPYGMEKHFY